MVLQKSNTGNGRGIEGEKEIRSGAGNVRGIGGRQDLWWERKVKVRNGNQSKIFSRKVILMI